MTVEERLAIIETLLKELKKGYENHLEHHFRYTFYAWTIAAGLIITQLIKLLKW